MVLLLAHVRVAHLALGRVIKIERSSFNLFKLNEMHWIMTHRSYFCVYVVVNY